MFQFAINYDDFQKLQMSLWARKDRCKNLIDILKTMEDSGKVKEYENEIKQLDDLEARLLHSAVTAVPA